MAEYINLTAHDVTVVLADGQTMVIPRSGQEARLTEETVVVGEHAGAPLYATVYGGIYVKTADGGLKDLPRRKKGVLLIVSMPVRQKSRRKDLVSPGALVRNEVGAIVGCQGFNTNLKAAK